MALIGTTPTSKTYELRRYFDAVWESPFEQPTQVISAVFYLRKTENTWMTIKMLTTFLNDSL